MSTATLFQLAFYVAAPFWALMIVAPGWRVTRAVMATPYIVLPTVAVEIVLLVPILPEFWTAVSNPTLEGVQRLVSDPEALTALWAQILAWDLFLGRWIYLDSRELGINPFLMAPLLIFTILLSPLALPLYLLVRLPYLRKRPPSATPVRPVGRSMA
ncbi:ABA4-like family protein [Nonomuraea soli]|uniref:DUF4281 domain-containing protein n=1 Tax=Nonomuraea soli TaxID=1032476 RepID=A0A7W0CEX4_9ACTN|nr:ABA4-like family protein [Nonomuraea soli]MBA2889745.1 hypothetical protein [Nonomuraea soli]